MALAKITHAKKAALLKAFAKIGTVSGACLAAKVSRGSHHIWMRQDEAYRAAFEDAKDEAADSMEQEAITRARDGWNEPVYQGGKMVGTILKKSDTLLIFMLKAARPEKFRERHEISGPRGGPIEVTSYDLSKLTLAELENLRACLAKAQPQS